MIKDLLIDLEIDDYEIEGSTIIYNISDSNEFASLYQRMEDNTDLVLVDDDKQSLNENEVNVKYEYMNYTLELTADFNENKYKLVIK